MGKRGLSGSAGLPLKSSGTAPLLTVPFPLCILLQDHSGDDVPTIRIDDQVWGWLQSKAKPFEDTPNSVLRRLAGLDGVHQPAPGASSQGKVERNMKEQSPNHLGSTAPSVRVTGEGLNRRYRLGAKHALYHKEGSFYEQLQRFPAIYCDPRGFVRFQTQEQFDLDPRLSIGQKVNIPGGLHTHPGYELFPKA